MAGLLFTSWSEKKVPLTMFMTTVAMKERSLVRMSVLPSLLLFHGEHNDVARLLTLDLENC